MMRTTGMACAAIACALGMHLPIAAQQAPSAAIPPRPPGIIGEPTGSGPWPAVAEARADLPTHTFYRPADPPAGALPLLVWGNGACRDNGLSYAAFLREIASHGFLVISLGHPRFERGPQAAQPESGAPPPPAPGTPGGRQEPDETQVAQMFEAIDWAQRANAAPGGAWQGRIDTARIAVGGHSCGGLQALSAAADPRVATALIFNSGVYVQPGGRSGVRIDKTALARLHGPVGYFSGGPGDMAHANSIDDVERISHVAVFFGALPVGHGGTFWSAPDGGDWGVVAGAWLKWQLRGDTSAGRMFAGADCTLCKDPRWTVVRKQLE